MRFGGIKVEGVYVLKHNMLNLYQLVKHFVVYDNNNYIDVTPFNDDRLYNWFIPARVKTYNTFIQSLELINKKKVQETKTMYYVYCYIDPDTNLPIYVGKGKTDRAYVHIKHAKRERKNKNTTRFLNKLETMLREDKHPHIIFIAQNIVDENVAYDIEEAFIKQYGRIGYEDGGILLNICENSRPPNHKGKTYEEIYGVNAEEQKTKRQRLQIEAGGWFRGRNHTEEMKARHSERFSGQGNPRYGARVRGTETALKISQANKGKKYPQRSYDVVLIDTNTNTKYNMLYSDLSLFCKQHNLSYSTLSNQLHKGWGVCKKGKTNGWLLQKKN